MLELEASKRERLEMGEAGSEEDCGGGRLEEGKAESEKDLEREGGGDRPRESERQNSIK